MEYSQIILEKISNQNISAYRLSRETGISESLFSKWKKSPTSEISSLNLTRIADYLGCSVDYLLGRDGRTEKPTPVSEDGLTAEQVELVRLFESASPSLRAAALAVLRSAEEQGKAQGGASAAE